MSSAAKLMCNVLKPAKGVPVFMWTKGVQVEADAEKQILKTAQLPIIHSHIAVMPDVHVGKGATVGTVIPTVGAIIPAAVGVDIGCGMAAVRTSLRSTDLPSSLKDIRSAIEAAIPHGRTDNGGPNDKGAFRRQQVPLGQRKAWKDELDVEYNQIISRHSKLGSKDTPVTQLGTLGTGNHFIELCLDEADRVWCMLHSGSRGVGNRIGTFFIEKAKQDMKHHLDTLPDRDLAYLQEGSPNFDAYVVAVHWAQKYAKINRQLMMEAFLQALAENPAIPPFTAELEAVNCHHNYVQKEKHFGQDVWLTRKGAVRAGKGDMGIIPGSMGAKSFIVRGLGNDDSFHSCSHGAGRSMSRTQAAKKYTIADHIKATEGIECRKDAEVIDETPMAYKDIHAVMGAQENLVEIVHTLRQIVCVKG